MPLDYSDPRILKFLIENFDKENEKRVSWFIRNKEKIVAAATFGENFKDYKEEDIYKATFELSLPGLSCQHTASVVSRRRKIPRDGPVLGESASFKRPIKTRNIPEQMILDLKSDSVMKPIEPDVVKIFYKGLPFGGRREYLKARSRKIPEDTYYLDQTTYHGIGWKLKEGSKLNPPLTLGRFCTLMRELDNRTGPHPDPQYYQKPLINPYAKC